MYHSIPFNDLVSKFFNPSHELVVEVTSEDQVKDYVQSRADFTSSAGIILGADSISTGWHLLYKVTPKARGKQIIGVCQSWLVKDAS